MPARPRGRPPAGTRDADASRRELLDAAAAEFAASGYTAATVERIVRRAGLSKGTFYWLFESKDHLFMTLLEERLDTPVRALLEAMREAPPDQPTAPTTSRGLAELFAGGPDVVRLLHEYWSAATRDPAHGARYRRRHAALREALAAALTGRHDSTGVPLTMPADELAEAFIALGLGLGMASLVDHGSVRAGLFGEVASLVYDGMVWRAEQRSGPPRTDTRT